MPEGVNTPNTNSYAEWFKETFNLSNLSFVIHFSAVELSNNFSSNSQHFIYFRFNIMEVIISSWIQITHVFESLESSYQYICCRIFIPIAFSD